MYHSGVYRKAYKVIFIGLGNVGKRSLVNMFDNTPESLSQDFSKMMRHPRSKCRHHAKRMESNFLASVRVSRHFGYIQCGPKIMTSINFLPIFLPKLGVFKLNVTILKGHSYLRIMAKF